jgi:hypothetical protein
MITEHKFVYNIKHQCGAHGSVVVKPLWYKQEGRGFKTG